MISQTRLVAPITLVGFTALSVEIMTKRETPCAHGGAGQHPGAPDVVLHRLARAGLHERHVLVRRGVEDEVGPVLGHHRVNPPPVGHVADHGVDVARAAPVAQVVLDGEEAVLVPLEQHQTARAERQDLPAQLRPDRAAGAGDENASARR